MFYHLFCINGKETIYCTSFFFKKNLFFSRGFTLLDVFKFWASCYLTYCSISFEKPLNCICIQLSIKVNIFIRKNMYPLQNSRHLWKTACFQITFSLFLMFRYGCCIVQSCGKFQVGVALKNLAYKKECKTLIEVRLVFGLCV